MNINNGTYSILLVDDHAIVRAGYKALLQNSPLITSVFEAESGEAACQQYNLNPPHLVIMDLSLGGIGGLATIKRILSRDSKARILVFSMHDEITYVERALAAGARGYLTKSCSPETMLEAVKTIIDGKVFIEKAIAAKISRTQPEKEKIAQLSEREFEIFCLIARGLTTTEIANNIHLSQKTIANYKTIIKSKLEVKTLSELTHLAYATGLLEDHNDKKA